MSRSVRRSDNRNSDAVQLGIDPLGTVRRSQLISAYGIGAVIDLEKGSFMPMGLEDWEGLTRLPSLSLQEARLEAQLGVTHFRLPPVAEQIAGTRLVNPRSAAPAIRFPNGMNALHVTGSALKVTLSNSHMMEAVYGA